MACWGLSPPTSAPCLCQRPPHLSSQSPSLSVSHSLSLSPLLSVSQPLFLSLIPGGGAAGGPAQALSGKERRPESLPSYSPLEGRRRKPLWSDVLGCHPQHQGHLACSWPLSLLYSPQGGPGPPGQARGSVTPSLRLRSEGGLTLPPPWPCLHHGICRDFCPLHSTDVRPRLREALPQVHDSSDRCGTRTPVWLTPQSLLLLLDVSVWLLQLISGPQVLSADLCG